MLAFHLLSRDKIDQRANILTSKNDHQNPLIHFFVETVLALLLVFLFQHRKDTSFFMFRKIFPTKNGSLRTVPDFPQGAILIYDSTVVSQVILRVVVK